MKFLCLAYGDAKDWAALTQEEQTELLAQDQVIRDRGALMAAIAPGVTTVAAWHGQPPTTSPESLAQLPAPLAGFSIIDAADLDEVIQLVAKTPCAYAKGAIEIRPILTINDPSPPR
jgi:hypothetical protein